MDDHSSLPMTPEQALVLLSGPDAIMEAKVEDALRVYLEANVGSTDIAIDALVQGYCANAQVTFFLPLLY
uniref:CUE domain-containing protein n=1 Tax=Heterorhabditis bacteriophora TaxID=37862 RepID=A0A1I7WYD7_HETBA